MWGGHSWLQPAFWPAVFYTNQESRRERQLAGKNGCTTFRRAIGRHSLKISG